MYAVSVTRTFVAQHFLTVPDPGPEGTLHSHHFTVEATVSGPELNEYGYLVDIDALSDAMDVTADAFRDVTLNDRPEFAGRNPSVEHLSRVFGDHLLEQLELPGATSLEIAIQEDDVATVRHTRTLE